MSVTQAVSPTTERMGDAAPDVLRVEPMIPPQFAQKSLRVRAIFSSFWTLLDYGSGQALRFISSLILARLLVPDVFGLMALVSVFLLGLEMFSDIGLGPSVIQNARGDERDFLNTAWTMQVVRGFVLWIAACVGAWPIAQFFNEPALIWIIPIAGFSSVIMGFYSTSMFWLNRRLDLRKLTMINVCEQVLYYVVVFAWAVLSPTIWALLVGSFASQLFVLAASHVAVRGHRNRFQWNPEDARVIFNFGKWIFVSTALTFFAMQADRIMCGRLLGTHMLGVFGSIALPLAMFAPQFIKKIGNAVAFPVLSEVARTNPDQLASQLRRVRVLLIGGSLIVLVPLMTFGDHLVHFLYPEKWWDAGWMVRILAGGALAGIVNSTYGSSLLALGQTRHISLLQILHLVFLVAGALIGYYIAGAPGFIIGVAMVEWLNYPATAWIMSRSKLWHPSLDLAALTTALIAIALELWLYP